MRSGISVLKPSTDAEWSDLPRLLNGGVDNPLLVALTTQVRGAGCTSVLVERNYIDRDFSAAYSSFYASLFRPYRKHCLRAHFFRDDISGVMILPDAASQMEGLERSAGSYLGNVVLRPLTHAPVSSAYISADVPGDRPVEVGVRSTFSFHLMGVELRVDAMPLAQQDTRTGACAQATMWMAGRHFHNRYRAPWFSMPDITSVALNPADQHISRSLPAGSDFLTADNMVRALRAMGRHPVMYAPDLLAGVATWTTVIPKQVVTRYVDSGIPVILGVQSAGNGMGHAVVAVGTERNVPAAALPDWSTSAEFVSHFLVNDDQRGSYCPMPVSGGPTPDYEFCFETDIKFLIVPLPEKVFMTAEVAELIALDYTKSVTGQRNALAAQALGPGAAWDVDAPFYDALINGKLVVRTYLTYGWKYKARALRNGSSPRLTSELMGTEFPRYVWVTEFSDPATMAEIDPCNRSIRGHVVVDATGSRYWDSVLVVDVPGLSLLWHFDPAQPAAPVTVTIRADTDDRSYFPKIRGSIDFQVCAAPLQAQSSS